MNKKLLVILVGSCFMSTAFSQSIIYRYTSNGKTVYSDSVPANEQAKIDVLSSKTMALKRVNEKQLSSEQVQEKMEMDKNQKDITANSEISKQKDLALLANYSSLDDIEKMKSYELQQINRSIQNDTDVMTTLKDKKAELDNKSKNAVGNVSPKDQQEVKDLQQNIDSITANLEKNKKLYDSRDQKYNEDKTRYTSILQKMASDPSKTKQ